MIKDQFSFSEFGFSSQIIRDLVEEKDSIKPFSGPFFSIDKMAQQAREKEFSQDQRKLLVNQLNSQNEKLTLSESTKANITALQNENAVTITTGHQLNLLTGPLYSIYKVAQIISLSIEMNKRDEAYTYVPVFWMATEDHDFDEINHIHLFGNKLSWEKEGQVDKIVGEVVPDGIREFTDQIEAKYQDEELKKSLSKFTDAYINGSNLAAATRFIMNELFTDYGLVIIDGNDAELKKAFVPVAEKEVAESFVFKAVTAKNEALLAAGYHNQVFVRECNLFHISADGTRVRISKEGDVFHIGNRVLNKAELQADIANNPKQYSPNALLRPVYQELILPNIAYIGGGGEIAYWLQLMDVFKAIELRFPLLRVRDSILLLRQKEMNDLAELELEVPVLKRDLQDLLKEIALEDVDIEIELKNETDQLDAIKAAILEKAESVNKGFNGMIEAEFSKMQSGIQRIESKLIKAEKGKHEQKGKKITRLQSKIFPKGGFQERYENFLPYFLADDTFVSKIVDTLTAEDQPKIRILEL